MGTEKLKHSEKNFLQSLMDWSGTELRDSAVRSWHQTSTIAMATYIIKINKNW
jgi:hypothetical protein